MLKPWLTFIKEHGNSERILDALVVVKLLPILKHIINHPKKFHRIMNVAYLKVMHRLHFHYLFIFFLGAGLLMSFHGHSCPSIIIICIQPRAGMREWRVTFFFCFF